MRRVAPIAATSAAMACLAVTGCASTITGARREGPAPTATVRTPSSEAPAIASNPAALASMVRRDSSVSATVREDLIPCAGDGYPLDTDSGDLTSGDGPDLVVNITTCGEGLGIAAYVYRMVDGKYLDVFADERPPVYGSVADGRLQIVHEVYRTDDQVAYPTGEEAVTYVWRGNRFLEASRSFSDFTEKNPTTSPEPTSTSPAPMPHSTPVDPELPTTAPPTPTPTASDSPSTAPPSSGPPTASATPTTAGER